MNKHTSNIWQNSIGNGLNTDKIFEKSYINKIPKPLKYCEELFDPNVLVIKKLVKDLGDLTPIVHKERKKKNFLYDDSSIITHICFTEVNKKIQSYGLISLEYDKPNASLINSNNRLKFNILNNIQREFIMLQLEVILNPKKIETVDSKITNFSIILIWRQKRMKFVAEFKIEGFQNFQQYFKINPINIQIIDPQIQNKLLFYANKYKYRSIVNSLLFSSSIQNNANSIFITTNELNHAKEILIDGKLVQGIGVIFTSEIEDWKNIKKPSDWVNVVLTDSQYPIAAKHFVFAFETTNLHNILYFEYSLVDGKGKLIEFKTEEDKIPALSFTIQIVN